MSKEDDIKFLKIQTCVMKVSIHCDGCKQKVKKLLQKVDGVFRTAIDAEQGIVTVSGNVDPATLIKKLNKAGKRAELLHPKGVNITQLQKPQPDNHKALQNKDNGKPPKSGAGGGNGKDQKGQATPLQQQMKAFKDLKIPQLKDLKLPFQKDTKSVKFALPPEAGEDCSDYDDFDDDDEDDFDDEDIDEFDSFDADFDDDFRNLKLKPGSAQPNAANGAMMMPDKKNGKKGGGVEIPVQVKGMNGNIDAKNGKKGSASNNQGGGGGKNAGKVAGGGSDVAQDHRNAGNNGNPKPNINSGKNGGGGGGGSGGRGGLRNEAAGGAAINGQPMGLPAGFPAGMNAGQMGFMPPAGQAVRPGQGFPPGMAPPGYFPAGGMPPMNPEMMAAAAAAGGAGNPYQQQYMAAMMQQQQRMMMNGQDRGYPPMMGYPRPPPPPAMYMAQPPPYSEPYTNYFSDENANSCSIM